MRDVGLGLSLWCALTLACGHELYTDSLTSEGCPAGAEGCPCADRACDDGLVCVEGACQTGVDGTTSSSDSGASTSSTSSGSTGAATTGACDFICFTDAPQGESLCDVFAQDCPEGQKCAAYDFDGDGDWDSSKCVDVIGDGVHGESCTAEGKTGVDDCAEGVMCWNLDEDGVGTCVVLCTGTPESPVCAPSLTYCVIPSDGTLNLCLGCHPLTQQWCGDSHTCVGFSAGDGFFCTLDTSDDMAPEGTPCEVPDVCNPGLMCADVDRYPAPDCQGSIGCCAPFCELSDINACAGLSVEVAECLPYFDPGTAPAGLEDVGVCGVES